MWWRILISLAVSYVTALLQPKPEIPKPATKPEGIPRADQGAVLSMMAGTGWKTEAQVAYADKKAKRKKIYGDGGKK